MYCQIATRDPGQTARRWAWSAVTGS